MAPSGARPSTGPEKRSAPRAGQRLGGVVASRWRPQERSLRGRDRRSEARVSLVLGGVEVMRGRRASYPFSTEGEGGAHLSRSWIYVIDWRQSFLPLGQ